MPTFEVTAPDGTKWDVTAPQGATQEQVLAFAQSQWKGAPKQEPASVEAGGALRQIPRQLGLTARYALEGLPVVADTIASPFRAAQEIITGRKLQQAGGEGGMASKLADMIGLPQPQSANERVVGDASRLVAGSLGMAGTAQGLSNATTGAARTALQAVAANPWQQAVSAAGAGAAGGSVREAGGSPLEQAAASFVGGLAAPAATAGIASAGKTLGNKVAQIVAPPKLENVDQRIELVLKGASVNWQDVPERIKQGMRGEVQQAMASGQPLNADALRRLLDFKAVGVTPTKGMLTQDPVQITRERNLAKIGANSSDTTLQALPMIENRNSQRLLDVLDEAGAKGAPDRFATGEKLLGAVRAEDASRGAAVSAAYGKFRDATGKELPVPIKSLADDYRATVREFDDAIPSAVRKKFEGLLTPPRASVAHGKTPEPPRQILDLSGNVLVDLTTPAAPKSITIEDAERLIKTINRNTNPADRPAYRALGELRSAVQRAILDGSADDAAGSQAAELARAARGAAADRFDWIKSSKAIKAALDGAEPDRFVQQYIIGQGSSVKDVRALSAAVAADPQTREAVKQTLVAHLKGAATGGLDDVTKFNASTFAKALDSIGERKLSAFFTPDEIAQLQAIKRVGVLTKVQPDATAVNNSNSGALSVARAIDALDRIAGKLPMGLDTTIQGVLRGVQQQQALNVPAGLLAPMPALPMSRRVLLPAAMGGLLAAQPAH